MQLRRPRPARPAGRGRSGPRRRGRVAPSGRGRPFGSVYEYTVRVEADFNAALGPEVVITRRIDAAAPAASRGRSASASAPSSTAKRAHGRTNLCSLVAPAELSGALEPYPRPRGHGRVALLAGGSFANARVMALDRAGRVLGYGFGDRRRDERSPCARARGARRSSCERRGQHHAVAVRDLRTLRVLRSRRAPEDTVRAALRGPPQARRCSPPAVDYPRAQPARPGSGRPPDAARPDAPWRAVPGHTVALARGSRLRGRSRTRCS